MITHTIAKWPGQPIDCLPLNRSLTDSTKWAPISKAFDLLFCHCVIITVNAVTDGASERYVRHTHHHLTYVINTRLNYHTSCYHKKHTQHLISPEPERSSWHCLRQCIVCPVARSLAGSPRSAYVALYGMHSLRGQRRLQLSRRWSRRHSRHDYVIKWKHFPRYWPFVWGIHRSPVNSPHKG